MEAARAAVNKITGQRGHHTTVEESVGPAVTQETIKPMRHEEATQAIDREVHQHHYHTTVQPLQHQEKLPEKHTHNILPAEEREFHHDNARDTEQRLASEMAHFKDHRVVEQTRHTQAAAPTVTGEHVHHHVHETVVPVIQKETIQPEVVHTTIPVHETHHAAAQHHGLSALPMKTLDEFKTSGGVLTGGKHGAHEEYDGPPRKYNEKLSTTFEKLGLEAKEAMSGHHTSGTGHHTTGNTTTTTTGVGSNVGSGSHHGRDSGISGFDNGMERKEAGLNRGIDSNTSGSSFDRERTTGSGLDRERTTGSGLDRERTTGSGLGGSGRHDLDDTTTQKKPSLLQRLNPRTDADGDGKRGLGD
ncbi:hypothetical protein LTR99_007815 [Exophiala xenobiotica]|uniref:Allergen n=1 Tax=Vermiconidia calcicola TaxID=1690605 RepID=A0AAV9Q8L2_9PEZI|nr:hypothetical protein LTR92_003385 [Exophiala xenobiotica]KAK5535215.1 hypothetical protein LTR25_006223 [Vermiconidia calcicola]KAK5223792.1 hypothetical protein LTR72_005178 [Exophiala xenobiotica]KAK5289193.1 hypothetical protein LTR14_007444 [Exophiala xenobiotica]KAK5298126.1 hypothetical protein LTR99_007815 [Exophiala xenobiotica]